MALQRTENAYQDTDLANNEQEEFPKSFVCCVCQDLLYKPIVLSCGHVFCFWCVHQSMSPLCESHCPNCGHQYNHFPTICWMLHFLLLKMYPVPYNRREIQTLEEEKKGACYSPQIDDANLVSEVKFDHIGTSSSASKDVFGETPEAFGQQKISIADMMCSACKQILFHPVVLNCGHVYCESCIKNSADDQMLRCQICQLPHPGGFPKVCFKFDHFIKEQFPEEHAKQRDAVQHINDKPETPSCSLNTGGEGKAAWWSDPHSKVHVGVGCDFCGMFPIVGDRYRCKDCKERVGFDLCAGCYKIRSKIPGRFNQQHTPDHEFELKQINTIHNIMTLVSGQFGDGSFIENFPLESIEFIHEDPDLVVNGDDGHTQNGSEDTD